MSVSVYRFVCMCSRVCASAYVCVCVGECVEEMCSSAMVLQTVFMKKGPIQRVNEA